ncbi:methylamine utilization protein MauG [Actibacterium sp. 188UL27-1]|nr:methylamine utilization protein MauG [Actibacterium sp. 188UL27-1]
MLCASGFAALADPLPHPLTDADFLSVDPDQAKLGQLLFYDKILSGNKNISCGTCHHADLAGGDGLSLGIGEGGSGVGPSRTGGTGADRVRKRIPRNAPSLWNLGHKDVNVLFHDGRLSISDLYGNGFNSPAEEWLPKGLTNIVAAQAVFPLTAQFEMAGNPKENEVAGAVHDRVDAAWPIISKRVRSIPAYSAEFTRVFEHINHAEDIGIVDIAEALSAFIRMEWRNHDSPFDAYLAGDRTALTPSAHRGMELFFGRAGCSSCHSGSLLTDQRFHALALPAFGPGRTRRFDPYARDVGRMGESDTLEDAYRFRTPPLRNVALTGPYGHNGAYPTLRGMVEHHLDPTGSRARWRPDQAELPALPWLSATDFVITQDRLEMARQDAQIDIEPLALRHAEIDAIVSFLHGLTGETAVKTPFGVPETVPSGLPVDVVYPIDIIDISINRRVQNR